jgi:hypothetical protein
MNRNAIIATVSAVVLFTPVGANAAVRKPAPKPAPVTILSVSETCQYGYVWVDVTFRANTAGTYDLWSRGDSAFQTYVVESDTLTANETVATSYSLPYPSQVDTFIARGGATQPLVSRSVAAAPCTVTW